MTANQPGESIASPAECPRAAARLRGRVVARPEIEARTRDAMFQLLGTHFLDVERAAFEADLAEKHCAILLEDESGVLRGFSTLMLYHTNIAGRPIAVVYSGDTIVDRRWWGSAALPRTWIRAVRQLAPAGDGPDLYWLLLTSGYRTYRFLPVFFRSFYPRYECDGRDETAPLLEALARERFGSRYDANSGIVRFARPQVLIPDLLDLPDGRTLDPHIAYFLARNPGHARGDELACLTRIRDDNLTPAGRRMGRSGPIR
jgi:hypothetical protein